jgi:hypothetical protein
VIGQTILHYRIVEQLGGGGTSVIYKTEDVKLDRFVALKALSEGYPLPVAIPLRDFSNEGRGGFLIRASWRWGNEGGKAGQCCDCIQEECEVFHNGISICLGNCNQRVNDFALELAWTFFDLPVAQAELTRHKNTRERSSRIGTSVLRQWLPYNGAA